LHSVADVVIDEMGGVFPELAERRAYVTTRIRREEERFLETLSKGLALLEDEIREVKERGDSVLPGAVVFKLLDTYGFPVDLTQDVLKSHDLGASIEGFEAAMDEQRARSREAWKGTGDASVAEVHGRIAAEVTTRFCGHETLETRSEIRALLVDGRSVEIAEQGSEVEVVVAETPFYAESGGQVGDRGTLSSTEGRVEVTDTRKPVGDLIVQWGKVTSGTVRVGETAELSVDTEARSATVRNHSGTHLLHAALRQVIGAQAMQKGSLVAPDRLRFDFTHDTPLSEEEIERIETLVNGWIQSNAAASVSELSYQEAIDAGAIAIFEEKYGDRVRVVSFGDVSTELCGGTHARATGDIGLLKIVSETGIAAGVRRIEALTGQGALQHLREQERTLRRMGEILKVPAEEAVRRVENLLEERRAADREIAALRKGQRGAAATDLVSQTRDVNGTKVLATRAAGVSGKDLRAMVDDLRDKLRSGVVLLASESDGKVSLALGVTPDLKDRLPAGDLVREVALVVGGKGGGRADFAQAGGSEPGRIDEAFEKLFSLVEAAAT
jgi:alanyl-tRNA synthetase